MSEEFTLEELRRQGAEIDSQKNIVGALGMPMNLTGDQFLAGSVFAQDQHIGVGRCGPPNRIKHLERGGGGPNQFDVGSRGGGEAAISLAQLHGLKARPAQIDGGQKRCHQSLIFPWLGHEIGGALLHRLHGQLDAAMRGDKYDNRLWIDR